MKYQLGLIMNMGKKKVATIALCGALALTIGTGVVFTVNAANNNEKTISGVDKGGQTRSNIAGSNAVKSLVRNDDGIITYSTDDGKTWNKGKPEGFEESINEDGTITSAVGNPPNDGSSMMVQNKDGYILYSSDGGITWSQNTPADVTTTVNSDGSISYKSK